MIAFCIPKHRIKWTIVVVVFSFSRVRLFMTPWTRARQALLSSTVSWSWVKFMSVASVTLSSHLILCCPLFLLPSHFPNIRVRVARAYRANTAFPLREQHKKTTQQVPWLSRLLSVCNPKCALWTQWKNPGSFLIRQTCIRLCLDGYHVSTFYQSHWGTPRYTQSSVL